MPPTAADSDRLPASTPRPLTPIPSAAATQKASNPTTGEVWARNPAAAPGKPTCESMWAAKLWPRSTTK